ncbi:MAG: phage tail tape measure protein [Ruminococcus sp.]|nr:phage tail tape measure protein [Ruminococcus sp.]
MSAARKCPWGAATIFGKQNLARMLAIINATDEDYQSLTDSIYNCSGAASEMAEIKLDNLKGSVTLLSSAAEGAAISIGEKLAPAANTAVQSLTDIVNVFNEGGLTAAL